MILLRGIMWTWHFLTLGWSRHPSWRIIYPTGRSVPLRRDDALYRCKQFGGIRVVYCRDWKGNLLP